MTGTEALQDFSDEALLAETRGDPEAFGVLYDRYERRTLTHFVSRTASAHLAADLTAETFAAALASNHDCNLARGSVRQRLVTGICKPCET